MDDQLARILSLLAHELRSPLGVIRGYLGLLNTADGLSDLHQQAVKAALKASDRTAELLTQASTLAQLRRGESSIKFGPAPIDTLVSSALDALKLPADPMVTLERGTIPSVTIRADAARLRSVFTSLAAAIVRAQTRNGRVVVSGDLHDRDNTRGVRIRIISESAVSNLNEAPLDISKGGLGLDLPIADYLIAAHGGHLSELREGDRTAGVVVWLPLPP